jgi:hypothetical protein
MSPVAGVGINYAIQGCGVNGNPSVRPVESGARVTEVDLAEVQHQREWPTAGHSRHAVVSRKTSRFRV